MKKDFTLKSIGLTVLMLLFLGASWSQSMIGINNLQNFPYLIIEGQTYNIGAHILNQGNQPFSDPIEVYMSVNGGPPIKLESNFTPTTAVSPDDSVYWDRNYIFSAVNLDGGLNDILVWPESPLNNTLVSDTASKQVYFSVEAAFRMGNKDILGFPQSQVDQNAFYNLAMTATNVGKSANTGAVNFYLSIENQPPVNLKSISQIVNVGSTLTYNYTGFVLQHFISQSWPQSFPPPTYFTIWAQEKPAVPPVEIANFEIASVATGIGNDFGGDPVKAYPNPVVNTLYFDFGGLSAESIEAITVMNSLGQEVIKSTSKIQELNVADLAPGKYFVRIDSKEGRLNTSFIKR